MIDLQNPQHNKEKIPLGKETSVHYVKNSEFSAAVVKYVEQLNAAKEAGEPLPVVPDYIADCFMRICEGLSHRPNFIRYSYREEMVMDGVENCLRAIENYNIEAATRTGKPNAFSYFTTIAWYAFLRRIAKEKKQQDIKMKYMTSAGLDMYATFSATSAAESSSVMNYVDTLRSRIDHVKDHDRSIKEFANEERARERAAKKIRPTLEDDEDE
jgi:hypothetical protein